MASDGHSATAQHDEAKQRQPAPPALAAGALQEYAAQEATRLQALAAADGTIEAQARLLADPRLRAGQRLRLAHDISRVQGNEHLQRVLTPSPQALLPSRAVAVVQRNGPSTSPRPLVKFPYAVTVTVPLSYGRYVKITGMTLKAEGSIEEMPSAQNSGASGTTSPITAERSREGTAIGYQHQVKRDADGWFASKLRGASSSLKPYTQENYQLQRTSKGGMQGKASYECGLDITPFVVQGSTLTFAAEFTILEFKRDEGGRPDFSAFKVTGKSSLSGSATNWPVAGWQANLTGEISVDMEPDYVTLALLALDCPVTWVAAAAAGGAAIAYFTLKDVQRQQQLGWRVRTEANGIAKAANAYAAVIVGESPGGMNVWERRAISQAEADLARLLAQKNMDRDTYLDLLGSYGLKDEYRSRALEKYRLEALVQLGVKIENEVRAWHDEHFWQTFFSGQSAEDDIAGAEAIIREARESGGEGFMR